MKFNNPKMAISFLLLILVVFFAYKFFYPIKLTITVPNGYQGKISLILSNVDKDILTVDKNGIGYITKQTFDRNKAKPIVLEKDGTDVSDYCVGFNPSTFWAISKYSYATEENSTEENIEIQYSSFELVPKKKKGEKQYYSTELMELVDKTKLYKK